MRAVMFVALIGCAAPALAEEAAMDCAAQAEFVMGLVQGRTDGVEAEAARKSAADVLDKDAGAMLVDWIYALPKEQLTPDVGTAWKLQCEAL
ncbi:hypothetical protein [Tropicibacter naphthalenivorans]|uniref:DNA primase n=1 Tax=Tropicibacter naphthalenivorans TaxID=441103 RepID=A0A0P1G861_9RHOB|nr:hypothetical protein [Tropicibacter naphthalenivorans]CUH77852.1 hypothetical protein TRN7648_01653 [Tropicibacter naphthalenivorans]SMC95730.1 hypothetical protein SAMN04488093_107188 [Tropicibacter naphthalenivorans]